MFRRLAVPLLIFVASATLQSRAAADDRTTAQQLFQQGKALMAAGNIAEACNKFEGAAELSHTPGVRLNLAACYEKLDRLASAAGAYDDALTLAERAGDEAAAQLAKNGRAALAPRFTYLNVQVAPKTAAIAGVEVMRDGQRVPAAAWGLAVPVDPGEHEIRVTAPGHAAWTSKAKVASDSGHVEMVHVPELIPEAAAPTEGAAVGVAVSVGPPVEPPIESSAGLFGGPGGTQRMIAVAGAGVGVVALGVGAVAGAQMLSKRNEYQSHENASGKCVDLACQTASRDAVSSGNLATLGFIAGAALIGGAAALWFTAPSGPAKAPTVALTAWGGERAGGVRLDGSF